MYATSITGINYLVAGKQKQWGYKSYSADQGFATTGITLPIPFANTTYKVTISSDANKSSSDGSNYVLRDTRKSNGFTLCFVGYGYSYIAVGN